VSLRESWKPECHAPNFHWTLTREAAKPARRQKKAMSYQSVIDGEQDLINAMDHRFIQDDLNQLLNLHLLKVEYNTDGTGSYGITRNAVRFIEAINETAPSKESCE